MAKLIVAIDINETEAKKLLIEHEKMQCNEIDEKDLIYFTPDGKVVVDNVELEIDEVDDSFFVFEFKGVEL